MDDLSGQTSGDGGSEQPKWKNDYSMLDEFVRDETDRMAMNEIKKSLEEETDEEREILITELVGYLSLERDYHTLIGLEMQIGDERLSFQRDFREALERAEVLLTKKRLKSSVEDAEAEWLADFLQQHTVSQKDINRIDTMWTAWREEFKDLLA